MQIPKKEPPVLFVLRPTCVETFFRNPKKVFRQQTPTYVGTTNEVVTVEMCTWSIQFLENNLEPVQTHPRDRPQNSILEKM